MPPESEKDRDCDATSMPLAGLDAGVGSRLGGKQSAVSHITAAEMLGAWKARAENTEPRPRGCRDAVEAVRREPVLMRRHFHCFELCLLLVRALGGRPFLVGCYLELELNPTPL